MKFKVDPKNHKTPSLVAGLVDKSSVSYELQEIVWRAAKEFDKELKIEDVHIEHPANPEHGDYSSNIAMVIFSKTKNKKPKIKNTNSKTKKLYKYKNPLDLAKEISKAISYQLPACRQDRSAISYLDEVKVAPPGFINFWLSKDFLLNALAEPVKLKEKYGSSQVLKGKKILLEHTSPNPQTTIMVGHLRNNFLGMTTARMLGTIGAKVIKDCIVNDRGVHICRALFGYLVFAKKDSGLSGEELKNFKKISDKKIKEIVAKVDWKKMIEEWIKNKSDWWAPADLRLKSDHFNLVSYVLGSRAHSLSKKVKSQVNEILLAWEAEDENVWKLWRKILQDWSALGYQETYRRIGSVHDWVWYESDCYKMGKEIVEMGLKKRVFKKSQGAIVSNLSDYSLSDAVLIKSDGSALYHTQDLALTKLKQEKFPSDLYIWDIGVEQTLYLKQLFAMCEQLGFGKLGDYFHLSYELINLKAGRKMSTREGTVIPADELLDELHNKARKIIETSDQELRGELSEKQKGEIAEKAGLAAAKYGMLRYSRETTIYFDIDESLSLEGNSGPYLQYTYARAKSVLRKADKFHLGGVHLATSEVGGFNEEEMAILRTIYQFPEVVLEAAKNFAPNLICNFLFDLAQKFNTFYNRWPILEPERAKDTSDGGRLERSGSHDSSEVEAIRNLRLLLTASVAQVLKNGLTLLGIKTLKRM